MTERFSEDEAVAAVARLTRVQLISFVQAEMILPLQTDSGPMYRQIDLVRMELLCELSEQFELGSDALGVVISLIDQLYGVRAELQTVLDAVGQEPSDVRQRILEVVRLARTDP
ncbi:MAG: hypothetical protein KUG69_08690 [Marinosulfonomonas sp.]|nr:hypothetical protein [Marinosulfonomonas sp.]